MIYQFFYIKKCIQNSYVDIIKETLNENLLLMSFIPQIMNIINTTLN